MTIYHRDLNTLMAGCANLPDPPIICVQNVLGFAGNLQMNFIEMEVTILDNEGQRMTRWTRVECAIQPGEYRGSLWDSPRADGPFLRGSLYLGFQPPELRTLHIANSHHALAVSLPTRDLKNNPPPSILPIRYQPPPGNLKLGPMPGAPIALTQAPDPMPPKADYTAES